MVSWKTIVPAQASTWYLGRLLCQFRLLHGILEDLYTRLGSYNVPLKTTIPAHAPKRFLEDYSTIFGLIQIILENYGASSD